MAHVINKGYVIGTGGQDALPPSRPAVSLMSIFQGASDAEIGPKTADGDDNMSLSAYARLSKRVAEQGTDLDYYTRPFGAHLPQSTLPPPF